MISHFFLEHPQPYSACQENAFAAYPNDCNKYLHCLWDKYQEFKCAPGLHWNNVNTTTISSIVIICSIFYAGSPKL